MDNKATLIHISDLHFSINQYNQAHHHAHSISHLQDLANKIRKWDFDRLIVSGDISNQGDKDSLKLAHDWIFNEIPTNDRLLTTGLKLASIKVIPVPGNHDSYNNLEEKNILLRNLRQISIDNYNEVFKNHTYDFNQNYCRYDWLDKESWGVWIISIDTCYLGAYGKSLLGNTPFGFIAKGKLSESQIKQISEWYDLGIQGRLLDPHSHLEIPSGKFCHSFKIVVMHHYLIRPDSKNDYNMSVSDRRRVIQDLAMIDFDMILCGHKHHSFVIRDRYGPYFEERGRKRYIFTYLRRLLGIESLPLQFCKKGKKISEYVTALIEWKYKKLKSMKEYQTSNCVDYIIESLDSSLKSPKQLASDIEEYLRSSSIQDFDIINEDEIKKLQEKIFALSYEKKKELKEKAKNINRVFNQLLNRLFIQSVAGSAAKASRETVQRSFDVIDINRNPEYYAVEIKRYRWNDKISRFDDIEIKHKQTFNHSRLMNY